MPLRVASRVESMSSVVAGDVDLQGVLGLDAKVPPRSQPDPHEGEDRGRLQRLQELDELMKFVFEHSTVGDTIRHPVPVLMERLKEK